MPVIENNTASAAMLYRLARDFATQTPVWGTALRVQTTPEMRYDMTLVSRKAYGRVDEFIVVMAAAGLDSVEQELVEQLLVLPTESQLRDMKATAGYTIGAGSVRLPGI